MSAITVRSLQGTRGALGLDWDAPADRRQLCLAVVLLGLIEEGDEAAEPQAKRRCRRSGRSAELHLVGRASWAPARP